MKIIEDGSLKGISISKDYIEVSYRQGHYVEAIVLTHYIIGLNMNRTFDTIVIYQHPLAGLNRLHKTRKSMTKGMSRKKVLKIAGRHLVSDYRFIVMANILFDMGYYDETLYENLKKFNSCRNKIMHRILAELPNQSEFDQCYRLGMKLWDDIYSILKKHLIVSTTQKPEWLRTETGD